jgi:outer membrane lipoprotein-sorting protein
MKTLFGRWIRLAASAPLILLAAAQAPSPSGAILERARATYAALQSYADTGVTMTEYQSPGAPAIVERHSFSTLYKSPRQYLFDFQKDPKAGAERFVLWGDGEDFHTWWSATRVHDIYSRGRGATGFALGSLPTKGTVLLVSPLLFPQAGLHGSIADLTVSGGAEIEDIGGLRCYKIIGEVRSAYGSGAISGARPATAWIDAGTFLVRKIFEDTPQGAGGGIASRITTTFEPQANPTLEDGRFRFIVPTNQR